MSPKNQAAFLKAVGAPANGGSASVLHLKIERPSHKPPYRLLLMRVPIPREMPPDLWQAAAAVLIIDSELQATLAPEMLCALFPLTPAEARVTKRLSGGKRSAENCRRDVDLSRNRAHSHPADFIEDRDHSSGRTYLLGSAHSALPVLANGRHVPAMRPSVCSDGNFLPSDSGRTALTSCFNEAVSSTCAGNPSQLVRSLPVDQRCRVSHRSFRSTALVLGLVPAALGAVSFGLSEDRDDGMRLIAEPAVNSDQTRRGHGGQRGCCMANSFTSVTSQLSRRPLERSLVSPSNWLRLADTCRSNVGDQHPPSATHAGPLEIGQCLLYPCEPIPRKPRSFNRRNTPRPSLDSSE